MKQGRILGFFSNEFFPTNSNIPGYTFVLEKFNPTFQIAPGDLVQDARPKRKERKILKTTDSKYIIQIREQI